MQNKAKEALRAGKPIIGAAVGISSPGVTEWLSHMGFDWLLLDMEHGSLDHNAVQQMIQSMSMSGTTCAPIVRPTTNDTASIKRILDMRAYGILAPMVNTAEDAIRAVRACLYPPRGVRGYGPRRPLKIDPEHLKTVEDQLLIVALLETQQAINNAFEILSVPGIDAGIIGPFDLSYDMGFGSPLRWDEPRYVGAYDILAEAARKAGKASRCLHERT